MENSKIEWTDRTFNPITVKGGGFYCFRVSPACKHCYAENMARRVATMQGNTAEPYTAREEGQYPELELKRGMLAGWAKKRDPKMNFVSSMTDIFGEFVPDEWVFEILDAMVAAPNQIFQMLTKRAERSHDLIIKWLDMRGLDELPGNMWIGFSVEDAIRAYERLPWLVKIPAEVRFISCEPLLTAIPLILTLSGKIGDGNVLILDVLRGKMVQYHPGCKTTTTDVGKVHWVIAGGESGNRKTIRATQAKHAIDLMQSCKAADVAFFFKQWGEYIPVGQVIDASQYPPVMIGDQWYHKMGKHKTGALLDGKEYKQFPVQKYLI